MMVMVANNSGGMVHMLAGKYPQKIGWLLSPGGWAEPRAWLPYAIDNGKFSAWGREQKFGGSGDSKSQWSEKAYFELLDRCQLSRYKPDWVAVPDEVGDKEKTISLWGQYERRVRQYGWRTAFVVQDGMTPNDVPDCDVVFVGGTTKWKWRNAALFAATFPRVHVGRVNWWDKLEYCERLGVESCDGTGFFRGGEDSEQSIQLQDFLSGHRRYVEQIQLIA